MKRGSRYYCVYLSNGNNVYLWADDTWTDEAGSVTFGNYRDAQCQNHDEVLTLASGQWELYFESSEVGRPQVERWESQEKRPHEQMPPPEFRYRNDK